MQRIYSFALAAAVISLTGSGPAFNTDEAMIVERGTRAFDGVIEHPETFVQPADGFDIGALLSAAHGAPLPICALAAQAVRNYGWSDWSDAPSTPLPRTVLPDARSHGRNRYDDGDDRTLSAADVQRLFEGLASDDACVRELSVRLVARAEDSLVVPGLTTRLKSGSTQLREVSALGLGLVGAEGATASDALVAGLRDSEAGVRANSAWALGRIENGRALGALMGLFRDPVEMVRAAAVVAVGHMDSTSAVAALTRVVRQDEAASVRRVAAWALGQLEAHEAVTALAGALAQDKDGGVREMAAWALGEIEDRSATSALVAAAKGDADDDVRETAVWALAEIGDHSATEVLGQIVANDRSSRVRGTAAWGIGQIEDDDNGRAPAGLLQALKDGSADTRMKAAWALGQIGDSAALPAIRDALKQEQSAEVSRALIRALLKSGEHSESALNELLNSKDPRVREVAVRGLAGNNHFNPWPWPWPRPRPFP